jgi:hypothetical protein
VALAAPVPTITERSRSRLWSIPVYWHLLSLDAPTVAVLWAWAFARATQVHAAPIILAVLGLGTWLIYIADRLLDSRFSPHRDLRERHFFHARHRRAFLTVSAAAGVLLLSLICIMPSPARREDTCVFAASMLYFAGVHLPIVRMRRWFPRELAVGILFACAAAIPAWSVSIALHARLIAPVLLFAGLCTLNCIAIEVWERPAPSTPSITIPIAAVSLAIASAVPMLVPRTQCSVEFEICGASFAAAILLLALDRWYRSTVQRNSNPEDRAHVLLALRIAADAALLTPLLFVLPWHP